MQERSAFSASFCGISAASGADEARLPTEIAPGGPAAIRLSERTVLTLMALLLAGMTAMSLGFVALVTYQSVGQTPPPMLTLPPHLAP